jgi:hypothetical protein
VTHALLSERYRIESKLARGGMGTVYRAHDEVLGRVVAIKVLAEELAEDPEFIERFRREARNAAALLHPNIASIFDYGTDDGRWYMVMELVDGEDLASRLDRDVRLPWPEVMAIGEQVASALAHAHARGVVHRDIKPANILITREGQAKVTDFGIALALQTTTNLTQTGSVLGTPNYLAPEQAKGERVGPSADLYSLGVVLFEALTGTRPFQGESGLALAMQHVTAPVPDPRGRGVALPDQVAALVVHALAKEPAGRFASADAMRDALAAMRDLGHGLVSGPPHPMPPAPSAQHPAPPSPPRGTAPAPAQWGPPPAGQWAPQGPPVPPGQQWGAAPPWPGQAPTPADPAAPGGSGIWPQPPAPPPGQPRGGGGGSRRTLAIVAAALVLGLVAIGIAYSYGRSRDGGEVTAVTRTNDQGQVEVQVPFGLVGAKFEDARNKLGKLGFEVDAEYEFNREVDNGHVVEVLPDEGAWREQGGRVSLTVSKGRGDEVRVPSGLVGEPFSVARDKLIDAGFAVRPSTAFSCDAGQAGKVESVTPPEGSYEQRASTVTVNVC